MNHDDSADHSGLEDSILPMNLVQHECPSAEDTEALEILYQTAAQMDWVVHLGDTPDVHQATDLSTAGVHGGQGRWTRGLLVQARPTQRTGTSAHLHLLRM